MRIDVLTLFPEMLEPFFSASIVARARRAGVADIVCTQIRDFATDKHHSVDDTPFGGGPGMVLMCPPVFDAVAHVEALDPRPATRVILTPKGERLTQRIVESLAAQPRLLVLCGHYEGFDQRIIDGLAPREISIGDYVLSGGEPAAAVLIDAVVRLLPGALGDEKSAESESFADNRLEYPQYTRPREFRGMNVPEILLSGDHGKIDEWRCEQRETLTRSRRPDLLQT